MVYSRYKVGEDGKTPYERQKGRKCNLEAVPFGELVRYKKLGVTTQERKSLESSWSEGVWLGHARGSSESLAGTKDGVVRAWTIRRMPGWGPEAITEMQGAPARPGILPWIHIPIAIKIDADNSDGVPVEVAARQRRTGPEEYISKLKTLKLMDIQKGVTDAPD